MEAIANPTPASEILPSDKEFSLQENPHFRSEPIAVSIVSQSRLLREGLVPLLHRFLPVHRVGEYSNKTEPREVLPNPPLHVVLVDCNIGSDSAFLWIKWWRSQSPSPAVLALELEDNKDVILACIEAGVSGYTVKESSPRDVANAIQLACKGQALCSPEVTGYLFKRLATISAMQSVAGGPDVPLTAREIDVLACIAQGFSNKEIAASLTIEIHTVKHHVHSILGKLKVSHRQDAAHYAGNQELFGTVMSRRR